MEGYRWQINRLMKLAEYFTRRIKSTRGYEMVAEQVHSFLLFFTPKVENFLTRTSEHLLLVSSAKHIGRKEETLDLREKKARLEKVA